MTDPAVTAWHQLPTDALADRLDVDGARGLDEAEVARRRERHGLNRLTPRKGKGPVVLFLSQFHHPLIYILLASALVTGVLKGWVDASVILGVVLLNAVIGFVQEMNALRAIEALARSLGVSATVLRAGTRRVVPATELVPGDVVSCSPATRSPRTCAWCGFASCRSTSPR
jgi:magnesium-transporting ATPase (P-type)